MGASETMRQEDAGSRVSELRVRAPAARRYWFLAPRWIGRQDRDTLTFHDGWGGAHVKLQGIVAQAVLAGDPMGAALMSAMGRHDSVAAQLNDALGKSSPVALTRASLLRGSGYRQLFIELTAQCNERCAHCYADSSPERREELDWPAIEQCLHDAKRLGFYSVQLTGGDPLLSRHCAEAARHACDLGFERVEVYTNGLALRGALYAKLKELPLRYALSMYSHDPVTHDAITGIPGSHRRTTEAISRVLADGFACRVGMALMDSNAEDYDLTVQYLKDLGVDEKNIRMDTTRAVGRGVVPLGRKKSASTIDDTQGADGLAQAKPQGEHKAGDDARVQSSEHADQHRAIFSGKAAVSYDGTVYPCIFSRRFGLGNVNQQSLFSILSDERPVADSFDRIANARQYWSEQLTCWECQLRGVFLSTNESIAS